MGKKRHSKPRPHKSNGLYQYAHAGIIKLFVVLGAILGIVLAILYIITPTRGIYLFNSLVFVERIFWNIGWGCIHVIICFACLSSLRMVPTSKKLRFRMDWWVLLIIALILILPTGNWGGLLILIAAVIAIFDKL
ncbi:MAG: hypothetical protein ACTSWN_04080 [Promethearchaeota archaeon]